MSSRRLRFYAPALRAHSSFELSAEELAHVQRSLRLKVGAEIEVFDGRGNSARARLIHSDRRQVVVAADELDASPSRIGSLRAAVAIPKGKRAPLLIEKLTELGVDRIVPLLCQHSQDSLIEVQRESESWTRRAIEACKQCHRNDLPQFEPPIELGRLQPEGVSIYGEPRSEALIWPVIATIPLTEDAKMTFVIGPEGGFSEAERIALSDKGFIGLRIGDLVLRIETAAVALASVLRARLDALPRSLQASSFSESANQTG